MRNRNGSGFGLTLHLCDHRAGALALQPIAQGAVRVDGLFAHKTFVCPRNRVQTATASLDRFAHQNRTNRHTRDDQQQKDEGKDEGFHDDPNGCLLQHSIADQL